MQEYIYRCSNCDSLNIETKDWVRINGGETTSTYLSNEKEDYYCPDCEGNHLPITGVIFWDDEET